MKTVARLYQLRQHSTIIKRGSRDKVWEHVKNNYGHMHAVVFKEKGYVIEPMQHMRSTQL